METKPKKPINFWLLLLILFSPVIVAVVLFTTGDDMKTEERDPKLIAWTACRQFISEKLKSPSTAEFYYKGDLINQISDDTFEMTVPVDAQNSFGATIRTSFYCKTYLLDGYWHLVELYSQ